MKTPIHLIRNTWGFVRSILSAVIVLILSGTGQSQDNGPLYYLYNGERINLTVDAQAVMVQVSEADGTNAAVEDNSGDASDAGIPGWSKKTIQGGNADLAANADTVTMVKAEVERLAAAPQYQFVSPMFHTADGGEMAATSVILVRYRDGRNPEAVFSGLNRPELVRQEQIGESGIWKFHTNLNNGFDVLELANELERDVAIEYATVDFISKGTSEFTPNDPLFSQSWGHNNTGQRYSRYTGTPGFDMDAEAAWNLSLGSSSIKVLVMDDGVQRNHPDLNVVAGRNFTNSGGVGEPRSANDKHGTAVAGCVGSRVNNRRGATGVAPNVGILAAKIYNPNSRGGFFRNDSWVVAALDWGRSLGARVSNSSWGGSNGSTAIDDAFRRTRSAGMIHFASAGNNNASSLKFPSRSGYVHAVGAAAPSGVRAYFSNYGSGLEFMAPGIYVPSADRTGSAGYESGDYVDFAGTSAASPVAAGVAALILSREPGLTADQVRDRMRSSCTDMHTNGYDTVTGYGLLNMYRSLVPGGNPPGNQPSDDHPGSRPGTSIGFPSRTVGCIETDDDEDYFRFTLSARTQIQINSVSSTPMDPVGYLQNNSGTQIAYNDDAYSGSNIRDFSMTRTLDPGTYHVRVRGYGTRTGHYSLVLSGSRVSRPGMRLEGSGGRLITDGDSSPSSTDGTVYPVVAARGGSTIRTFTVRNTGDANLSLNGSPRVSLSGSGAAHFQVSANPASSLSPGRSTSLSVRFVPTAEGTHRATVSIRSNDSSTSPYTFSISGRADFPTVVPDRHGDSIYSATPISRGAVVSGAIGEAGDEDYFRFQVQGRRVTKRRRGRVVRRWRPEYVQIQTTGDTDTYGYLMRGSRTIALNDDSGSGRNFSISRSIYRGTYYVRVRGYDPNNTTGSYTLYLR